MEFITFTDIVLILVVLYLSGRIKRLEHRQGQTPVPAPPEPAGMPLSAAAAVARAGMEPFPSAPVAPPAIPGMPPLPAAIPPYDGPQVADDVDRLVTWLKDNWLLKLGALLLLIGFGWLATYAFLNNWIGPMGRIALGIVAGVAFLVLGWWRIQRFVNQGGIFLVLGSTVILLTTFAAREIYDFFTPFSALALMFLSTAFVALASVRFKTRALALLSLLLAGIAPLLTNSPAPDWVSLYAYLLVVVIGAIWIVAITGWRSLTVAALALFTCYSLPQLASLDRALADPLLLFAFAFAAVFFLTNSFGFLKRTERDDGAADIFSAAGNGLLLLAWILAAAPDEWRSLIIAAWMVVFAAGAFAVFRASDRRTPFFVYAAVCLVYLAAATAVELDGAALTIAYAFEAGLIPVAAFVLTGDLRLAGRSSLVVALPVILSAGSIGASAWYDGVLHKHFFVLLILALVLTGLGWFFRQRRDGPGADEARPLGNAYLIGASIYAFVIVWLSLHALLENNDTAVMLALVTYTVAGLAAYLKGVAAEHRGLRLYGGLLLGAVVARLFLVDVWRMELSGRIITFFLVGLLLMSTAFLGRRPPHPGS